MLERTAARLEPGLQRALCKSGPVTRSRTLRRCKKQIDRSSSNYYPLQTCFRVEAAQTPSACRLTADGLSPTIDFLYPSTVQYLHGSTACASSRIRSSQRSQPTRTRAFSNTRRVQEPHGTISFADGETIVLPGTKSPSKSSGAESDQSTSYSPLRNKESTRPAPTNRQNIEHLENLLSFPIGDQYSDLWDLFGRIDPSDRIRYSQRVAIYLSKSNRISEANKTLTLFRSSDESTWTNDFLAAGISAMIRSKELDAALTTFNRGIELGLSGGVEHIVSDAIKREDWSTSVNTWKKYCEFLEHKQRLTAGQSDIDELLNMEPIKLDRAAEFIRPIEEIDNLGKLFIKFDKHQKSISSVAKRSRYPLVDFRQQFAEAALRQGCPLR